MNEFFDFGREVESGSGDFMEHAGTEGLGEEKLGHPDVIAKRVSEAEERNDDAEGGG